MNCLITGGSGFLGSHLVWQLIKEGHKVYNFDVKKINVKSKNYFFINGNINDQSKIKKISKKIDFIFHFAGLGDLDEALDNPIGTVEKNILLTVKILDIFKKIKKKRLKRFFYASSIYSMSLDGGFYSISKRSSEDYIKEFKLNYKIPYTIIRYGSLFGSRAQKNNGLRKIVENAVLNKKLKYDGSPKARRKYIHVEQASKLTIKLFDSRFVNKTINITGNINIKVVDLMNYLKKILKINKNISFNKKKLAGHYIEKPSSYKFEKSISVQPSKKNNFYKYLDKYILEIKKNK